MMKPCLKCGDLSESSYCQEHAPKSNGVKSEVNRARQAELYNGAWRRLSARARRMQQHCTDCGTRDHDMTADHLPSAHWKISQGQPVTLFDVEIVCRACNARRGPAVIGSERFNRWAKSVRLHNYADPGGIRTENWGFAPPGAGDSPITLIDMHGSE